MGNHKPPGPGKPSGDACACPDGRLCGGWIHGNHDGKVPAQGSFACLLSVSSIRRTFCCEGWRRRILHVGPDEKPSRIRRKTVLSAAVIREGTDVAHLETERFVCSKPWPLRIPVQAFCDAYPLEHVSGISVQPISEPIRRTGARSRRLRFRRWFPHARR